MVHRVVLTSADVYGRPWPVQVHRTLLAAPRIGCASTARCILCAEGAELGHCSQ